MHILDARIDPHPSAPLKTKITLLVDSLPAESQLVYRAVRDRHGEFYLAEAEGGFARIYYHNPSNETGSGGRTFNLPMTDGRTLTVRGLWMTSASEINRVDSGAYIEVDYALSREEFERGTAKLVGHAQVAAVQQALVAKGYKLVEQELWKGHRAYVAEPV